MPFSIVPVAQPTSKKFFDAGGSTFHTHRCTGGEGGTPHTWDCNSPYCNALPRECPDHGGKDPVTIGEEPWRT